MKNIIWIESVIDLLIGIKKSNRAMHLTEVTTIYSICGYGSLPAKSYGI